MFNRFVSITTYSTFTIFFCLVYFALRLLVLMALFWAAARKDSVSLIRFSCVRFHLFFAWSIHTIFFFPFWLSSYCSSVVRIVSGPCNQSFFVLFDAVFEKFYRCINFIFHADEFYPFSSFSWHIACLYYF